jgi:hypothetical protein
VIRKKRERSYRALTSPSNITRIVHNLGLATWFGGAFFGQIALNPTVSRISDRNERGRVLNEAWGRFNVVNSVAVAATLLTWRLGGLKTDGELRAPVLVRFKNLLLGGAAISGIASGILGARIATQSSEGDTPVESGTQPAPETPEEAAQSQRLISLTGTSALALLIGAIAASTVIEASAVKPHGILSRLLT